jgi:hypothetical protein
MTAEARWQSGYAAACKAVDAGSIPTLASIFLPCPGGGIGRRSGLKIRCPKGRAGSSPALGTNHRRVHLGILVMSAGFVDIFYR